MSSTQPIYLQLADTLRDKIFSGEYLFGDTLPPERAMAQKYGISHLTVRKALSLLQEEGLIQRLQGKGTFVNAPNVSMDMREVSGFTSFMQNHGLVVTNEVLHSGVRPAKHKYSKIFRVPEDDPVFECVRLRYGDGVPMAIEYNAVPVRFIPDVAQYDYSVYSLYSVYANNQACIVSERQVLEVVRIFNPQAKLLGVEEGSEVFLLTSSSIDGNGRLIEYTRIYNSDRRMTFFAAAADARQVRA
jgi:GntR family transcriptional regulator